MLHAIQISSINDRILQDIFLQLILFGFKSLPIEFVHMHLNKSVALDQKMFHYLESFHLVFLGCLRWGRLRDGHVFKPLTSKLHKFGVKNFRQYLFFSFEAVSRGRPFSSTRLVQPPSSPRPASHSSNLARSCFARAASWTREKYHSELTLGNSP